MYPVEIKVHYAPRYLPGEAGQEGNDAVQARPGVTRTRGGADTAPPFGKTHDFQVQVLQVDWD